jgi:hypothetical protein
MNCEDGAAFLEDQRDELGDVDGTERIGAVDWPGIHVMAREARRQGERQPGVPHFVGHGAVRGGDERRGRAQAEELQNVTGERGHGRVLHACLFEPILGQASSHVLPEIGCANMDVDAPRCACARGRKSVGAPHDHGPGTASSRQMAPSSTHCTNPVSHPPITIGCGAAQAHGPRGPVDAEVALDPSSLCVDEAPPASASSAIRAPHAAPNPSAATSRLHAGLCRKHAFFRGLLVTCFRSSWQKVARMI